MNKNNDLSDTGANRLINQNDRLRLKGRFNQALFSGGVHSFQDKHLPG